MSGSGGQSHFGHTFGHAIEAGLGRAMAARRSRRMHGHGAAPAVAGLVDGAFVERVSALLQKAGLPTTAPRLSVERYLELMRVDKKAEGRIRR
jgi:3-dehydroquinate synthase